MTSLPNTACMAGKHRDQQYTKHTDRGVTVEMSQEGRRVEKMMKGQEVNAEKSTHCFYMRCT